MPLLTWEVDDTQAIASLKAKQDLLMAAILERVQTLGTQLYDLVISKVTGEVLKTQTGQLARDVTQQAAEYVGAVCQTSVGIDEGKPSFLYAYVQEYGGEKWYDIYPVKAKALSWEPEGDAAGRVFAQHVHHPPLPERSYLRSSLAEMEDFVYTGLQETLAEVFSR